MGTTTTQRALTVPDWALTRRYGKSARPELVLLLNLDEHVKYGHWRVTGRILTLDPDDHTPRNLGDDQPLADVRFSAQANENEGRLYGFSVEVDGSSAYLLRASRLRRQANALSLIEKRMIAPDGYLSVDAFDQSFRAFVAAVGFDTILINVGERHTTYSLNSYRDLSIDEAITTISEAARQACGTGAS